MHRSYSLISLLVLVFLASSLLTGCAPISTTGGASVVGSGNMVEKTYDLKDFTSIETAAGAEVTVTRDDNYSVTVKVDDNAVDYLRVEVTGKKLYIGLRDGSFRNVTIVAQVSMPELVGAIASGGATLKFGEFTTAKNASFETSGGAGIEGEIVAGDVSVTNSGGGDIRVAGRGGTVKLDHSGGGRTELGSFEAVNANVNMSGGAQAEIYVSGQVKGEVTGGAILTVRGNPASVNVKTSGGGQVKQ